MDTMKKRLLSLALAAALTAGLTLPTAGAECMTNDAYGLSPEIARGYLEVIDSTSGFVSGFVRDWDGDGTPELWACFLLPLEEGMDSHVHGQTMLQGLFTWSDGQPVVLDSFAPTTGGPYYTKTAIFEMNGRVYCHTTQHREAAQGPLPELPDPQGGYTVTAGGNEELFHLGDGRLCRDFTARWDGTAEAFSGAEVLKRETETWYTNSWADLEVFRSWYVPKQTETLVETHYNGGVEARTNFAVTGEELIAFLQKAASNTHYTAAAAHPSIQRVTVDGRAVDFPMYALRDRQGNETNYIRLRDLAYALKDGPACFAVGWYGGVVNIRSGWSYAPVGNELRAPFTGDQSGERSRQATQVNDALLELDAIVLQDAQGSGYTYYKLRDLCQALGFTVTWSAEKGIEVVTGK